MKREVQGSDLCPPRPDQEIENGSNQGEQEHNDDPQEFHARIAAAREDEINDIDVENEKK